jgi:type II secretory pathway component PulJ
VSGRLAREEGGFGLVELVIAIAILNVVILALFATFHAGSLALQRASRISTAETVADKQMELYRAHLYRNIALHNGHIAAAASDATHTADPAWVSAAAQFSDPLSACTGSVEECNPIQTGVTGADGRTYRVDTYIRELTLTSGRPVKRVTVVVRGSDGKVLARLSSTFDLATGCMSGSSC